MMPIMMSMIKMMSSYEFLNGFPLLRVASGSPQGPLRVPSGSPQRTLKVCLHQIHDGFEYVFVNVKTSIAVGKHVSKLLAKQLV